ncbi:hypothetical protein SELMODRAFT_410384 [Selaginella moellendorffii]|uniref:Uncharacterized protein n=1 Tax=Selaginella moellendorffii TaxID=88036 RepID=D8REK6_SELML|nr:hypothetical protein SELMODRAFT_410384 [Selaginella moellendorffii]
MVASICGFGVALNSSCAAAAILPQGPPPAEKNEFVQKLLERSKANKEKNDRERLESYYKRNYTDYFEYIKRLVFLPRRTVVVVVVLDARGGGRGCFRLTFELVVQVGGADLYHATSLKTGRCMANSRHYMYSQVYNISRCRRTSVALVTIPKTGKSRRGEDECLRGLLRPHHWLWIWHWEGAGGANITIVDLSRENGMRTLSLVKEEHQKLKNLNSPFAIFIECDVRDPGSLYLSFENVYNAFLNKQKMKVGGGSCVLITGIGRVLALAMRDDCGIVIASRKSVQGNVTSQAIQAMRSQDSPGGAILNLALAGRLFLVPLYLIYLASKGGLRSLVELQSSKSRGLEFILLQDHKRTIADVSSCTLAARSLASLLYFQDLWKFYSSS